MKQRLMVSPFSNRGNETAHSKSGFDKGLSASSPLTKAGHCYLKKRITAIPPFSKGGQGGFKKKAQNRIMQKYDKKLKNAARALRKRMTDAELALWQKVRRKQVHGLQFYRQKPLLSFIVDFYCPKAKLVIELDGSQHFEAKHWTKDEVRDAQLAELGLRVLRFNNLQVLQEMDAVMEVIWREAGVALEIPPGPPLEKGGMRSKG